MKAVVVKDIGTFEYQEVDTPAPGRGEVLIETAVSGLCRTDLKLIEVGHRDLVLPRIPAEEVVGNVVLTGPDVDESWINKRVYIYPGTSCGRCKACRNDAGNLCKTMQIMGFHRDGGFADFVTAPVESLVELPDGLDYELAVFAEPLSCCLNALELSRLKAGETIAVWGAGPAGTLLARAAAAMGAIPTIIEPDERRRNIADALPSAPHCLFDVAIPAVGSLDVYLEAINMLKPRGRLIVFSGLPKDNNIQPIDMNALHYHEQSVTGAYGCSYRHSLTAIEWIASKKIEVSDMISHRIPLNRIGEALDIVRNREGMKILLYPEGKIK